MTTQMKFIRKITDGEVVKTIYPMGYNMQKELHSRKFNDCLSELFKILHYRKLRLCLYNPAFRLRNKAVRMGIATYNPAGDRLGNKRFCLEFVVDDFKLAILQARQFGLYNNCYYTIKDKLINRINKKDIPYTYDDDFEIRNDTGYESYEDTDGSYTCYNNGQEEWEYRVLSNDNNGVDEAIMTYLTDNDGIYNCDMDFLRQYIREDILFYELTTEDDDEEQFNDDDRVECPCCMEKFEDLPQGVDATTIRCGHTFCEPCINNWKQDHNTCPLCRKDIDLTTTEERDNDELLNYMQQENPRSVMENWFNDRWELIDALKEEDGLAHTLGYDNGESIDFNTELHNIMFNALTGDTLEVLWLEN